jgi:putative inorganic carbon (HCO3(-)) transporter
MTQATRIDDLISPPLDAIMSPSFWRRLTPLGLVVTGIAIAGLFALGGPAIAIFAALLLVAFAFAKPKVAFLLVLATLPLDWHLGQPGSELALNSLADPARFLVALLVFLRVPWKQRSPIPRPILGAIICFVLAITFSVALAPVVAHFDIGNASIRALYELASYLALAAAATVVVRTSTDLKHAYVALLIGMCATSGYTIYQQATGDFGALFRAAYPANHEPWMGRPSGLLTYSNSEAGYLDLLLPIAIGVALYTAQRLLRWVSILAIGVGSVALLLTQSRGGWMAMAVILALLASRFAPPLLRIPILVMAACAAVAIAVATPLIADRLLNIEPTITTTRFALWQAAFNLFLNSPVTGIGYGGFELHAPNSLLPLFGERAIETHNIYLQLLAETGVIGTTAFLLLAAVGIRAGWTMHQQALAKGERTASGIYLGVSAAIVATLIHGLVDDFFIVSPQFAALFWFLIIIAGIQTTLRRYATES